MSTSFTADRLDLSMGDVRRVVTARGWTLTKVEDAEGDEAHVIRDANGQHLHIFQTSVSFEMCRFGSNDVEAILEALAEDLDLDIISEYDEGFFDEEDDEE